jgi:hypothetical protein
VIEVEAVGSDRLSSSSFGPLQLTFAHAVVVKIRSARIVMIALEVRAVSRRARGLVRRRPKRAPLVDRASCHDAEARKAAVMKMVCSA